MPLVIHSGCRCTPHNLTVGGKDDSSHLTGLAVDIRALSSPTRFRIIRSALNLGFTRIGIGSSFIHIDIDTTKPSQVFWLY